jgi:hypothetical protein
MNFTTSTWMLIAFVVFMILSIWKLWAFMPNKQLEDDDKTAEAQGQLKDLMVEVIVKHKGELTAKELFFAIEEDEDFDSQVFWRFNHNRLNQLLRQYFIENPDTQSIQDIYTKNVSSVHV